MKALQNNSNNIISLFQTNDMDIERSEPFSIGSYHMGKMGSEWIVWNDKFTKTFKFPTKEDNRNFDKAKKKAYRFIMEHCAANKIVPPPPPI